MILYFTFIFANRSATNIIAQNCLVQLIYRNTKYSVNVYNRILQIELLTREENKVEHIGEGDVKKLVNSRKLNKDTHVEVFNDNYTWHRNR